MKSYMMYTYKRGKGPGFWNAEKLKYWNTAMAGWDEEMLDPEEIEDLFALKQLGVLRNEVHGTRFRWYLTDFAIQSCAFCHPVPTGPLFILIPME